MKKVAKTVAKKKEKVLGTVTHWYDKISVAVIKLKSGLKKGDMVKIKRGEEEFEEKVNSLQIDHVDVKSGKKGDEIAIKLSRQAKEGSLVCKA